MSSSPMDDYPASERDDDCSTSMLPTPPSTHTSRSTSPTSPDLTTEGANTPDAPAQTKKKKKKKAKKGAKAKESSTGSGKTTDGVGEEEERDRPPVLCISRNKHWRYISSYHGPWLQLPLELLESLLLLNLDPATLSAVDAKLPPLPSPTSYPSSNHFGQKQRDRGFASLGDYSPPDSPRNAFAALPPPPPFPAPIPGKATPPPIDPGVFRSVTHIRRLIDEAAELSVRASSGLSAAALGSMRGGAGMNGSAWATAQSLGLNPLGDGGGRNVAMSAMRVHRLRALAVQKLAAAYKTDEIASSVMVMQGGSVFDDIAERVLKVDPTDVDARYVHFFHEKIPSRQLAESTSTHVLDELIAGNPHRLEFYRTRGIVHCFRDEYALAAKDFTYAIKEARALRKARSAHLNSNLGDKQRGKGSKKKKGKAGGGKTNGQAPPNGTSASSEGTDGVSVDGPDGEPILLHPSVLPDAPEPIEPQCLFLRAAAYLQHAVFLIEEAIFKLEGIRKVPSVDGAEMRLCYVENGRYGGVEIGNPEGPLGRRDGTKLQAYREVLADATFREQIVTLVKKSMRDHRQFLSHFDTLEGPPGNADVDVAQRTEYAFLLSESLRPGSQSTPPPVPDATPMFTTYHPLLVESHFSILICHLMLGDFRGLLPAFSRTAALVDGLEGYPVFLPPRSMAQAEFVEVLERLAGGWKNGVQPHSLSRANSKQLAIEPPPRSPRSPRPNGKDVHRIPTPPSPEVDGFRAGGSSSSSNAGASASAGCGVNGSSSSSCAYQAPPSPCEDGREGLLEALDAARILLAPVAKRQREKAEAVAAEKAGVKGKSKKPLNINIPLHGPRVEIVLAWMAAVFLCELDAAVSQAA
ncbi:hypothetical protein L227DRAFT_571200 [Lentinus tigrinus ALCF2SS1-6]|uniref:Uncharacterized protein n=1 Tax=Lentinus tigrinus ALCF2SS1-6 TaxID=1328759 RepID=A0A5C2SNL4_9APHY|nr:hypothetical protein L227DRAFT_571200 [Lentinus tigrinus ALCF2SS1-6]